MSVDVSDFDKDQLAEYALNVYKVELDMRKNIVKLKDEVIKLQEKPKVEVVVAPSKADVTHIKNQMTGMIFPWSDMLQKHLGANGTVCDADGKEV